MQHTQKERFEGPISINSKGVGFFVMGEGTLEIETKNLCRALPGDTVLVVPTGERGRTKPLGKVLEVKKRAKDEFVGTVEKDNGDSYVIPDDKRVYVDIFIPEDREVLDGQKVLVKITDWNAPRLTGSVLKVIGKKGENNTEMEAIVLEKGFRVEFPSEVEAEAIALKTEYKKTFETEVAKRRDMRAVPTCTIDPFDAKDFDDALSVEEKGNGLYEIGVHIADVSHFVRPGSALEKEAEKRGLSVYLVDRTIPMLPEILSNDLCSLNPEEDKFTFSAVFTLNEDGEIQDEWFGRTVIYSDKRFTYEDAQDVISGKTDGPLKKELSILHKIAKQLEKKKFQNGAINFETEEVKFELDQTGKPVRVYRKVRLDTHKLVEEFMLLANRRVAEYIFKSQLEGLHRKGAQSVYRIHDRPDVERIQDLAIFLKALGFDLHNKDGEVTSRDISRLLKEVEGTPSEEVIKTATIRSMAKAVYSTKNVGHFGLAFKYYTHFTSPIRRYPDVLVHRFLERELSGGKIELNEYETYERLCVESSENEKRATDAERMSIKYKQVEYMQERVGQTFAGTITGVTEWGVYVEEKETKCEGMIKLKDLGDDFFTLDEKNYTVKGEKTGKAFRLGDDISFKVVSADLEKRILDYALVA